MNSRNNINVSIIIPVYNDSEHLERCLHALENQTYECQHYKVLVIDNNSTEEIEPLVERFCRAEYRFESRSGSYAARNKGVELSEGEIIAFIDADCLPQPHWIEEGIRALKVANADLAGGRVTFTFSPDRSAAEIYDSVTNMQIKENIETRKVSKTANLFTYRYVFDKVGLFPADQKSGGDVTWTKRATDAGFKLVYAPKAEVFHPARTFWPLMQKQFRVGKGQIYVMKAQNRSAHRILKGIAKNILKPPSPRRVKNLGSDQNLEPKGTAFLSMWLVIWLCQASTGFGRLAKLTSNLLTDKK